jgi:universal stress protein E
VLRRTCSLAKDFGTEVHLYSVAYNTQLAGHAIKDEDDRERMIAILVEKRLDSMQVLADSVAKQGIDCTYSVAWDYPTHESLARTVVDGSYELVVFASFGRIRGTSPQAALSQTDWQTLANCPAPCLLVRTSGLNPYNSVLAAIDPTHDSEKTAALDGDIIETAKKMSRTFGAGLRILHAYRPIASAAGFPTDGEILPIDLTEKALADSIEGELADLARKHGLDPGTMLLRHGRAADTILKTVSETFADLVVMGAISRGRVHDWVIGSTAEQVIGHLDCDLLAIKPAGFKPRLGKPVKQHLLRSGYRAADTETQDSA